MCSITASDERAPEVRAAHDDLPPGLDADRALNEQAGVFVDPGVAHAWQLYPVGPRETTVPWGLLERAEEFLDLERRQRLDLRRAPRAQ